MSRFNVPTATMNHAPSHSPPDVQYAPGLPLAHALGWFSIGLGLAELLAPRAMSRVTGVTCPELLQVYGLREIGIGMGILTAKRPASWMWARVAGDALDLITLGSTFAKGDHDHRFATSTATTAVMGVMALDLAAALTLRAAK